MSASPEGALTPPPTVPTLLELFTGSAPTGDPDPVAQTALALVSQRGGGGGGTQSSARGRAVPGGSCRHMRMILFAAQVVFLSSKDLHQFPALPLCSPPPLPDCSCQGRKMLPAPLCPIWAKSCPRLPPDEDVADAISRGHPASSGCSTPEAAASPRLVLVPTVPTWICKISLQSPEMGSRIFNSSTVLSSS